MGFPTTHHVFFHMTDLQAEIEASRARRLLEHTNCVNCVSYAT